MSIKEQLLWIGIIIMFWVVVMVVDKYIKRKK